MSADVDTIREALCAPYYDKTKVLAALDRLAAAEAQRDTLAEALRQVDRCAGEHDGITPDAFEALTDITSAFLAAVAPTEAQES